MPETPCPPPHDDESLRVALEAAGRKFTRQRAAVYAQLRRAEGHPTAEDLYREVRTAIRTISLATVYKALDALSAAGLAAKLADLDGTARYDARPDRHYHLRCLRTGAVEDLPTPFDPALIDRLDPGLTDGLRSRGFRVTGYRLELVGYFEPGPPTGPGPDVR